MTTQMRNVQVKIRPSSGISCYQLQQQKFITSSARQQFKLNFRVKAQEEKTQVQSQVTKEINEEELPWVKSQKDRQALAQKKDLPFGVYLIASALVAIAAVGSIFEFANQNPIFGVLPPDNPFYTPILGFFAFTGFPSAGYLFFKSVKGANEMAEQMDKIDGV
eukprot:TRINITY_DN18270_c0_g1_i1.p3 TRINITY_DN18270_c0_g1~~TRINITY_DN18270_c0_g1_i1.p3  ORF type:complete len:172 (-),score=21.77 TRINITY_DN18270_c0_g1_i1:198-686(-)